MTLLAALAALESYTHHKHPCDSLTSAYIDPEYLACQCGRNAALDAVRAALRVRFEGEDGPCDCCRDFGCQSGCRCAPDEAPGPDPEPVKETR